MSRIGKKPIAVPANVRVEINGPHLKIKGPLGELEHDVCKELTVRLIDEPRGIEVGRANDTRRARAMHGLHQRLISNKVEGVTTGFVKHMEIYGTGYSVTLNGRALVLQIGFCHEVVFDVPAGITVEIEQNNAQLDRPARFAIKGVDKEQVGQLAANIRAVRPPEPYEGKGIRYQGEYVRRKEGKAFTG